MYLTFNEMTRSAVRNRLLIKILSYKKTPFNYINALRIKTHVSKVFICQDVNEFGMQIAAWNSIIVEI